MGEPVPCILQFLPRRAHLSQLDDADVWVLSARYLQLLVVLRG